MLNCFSISRSLCSEEDDPIHEHLIPRESRFRAQRWKTVNYIPQNDGSRNKRVTQPILLIATADEGREIEQNALLTSRFDDSFEQKPNSLCTFIEFDVARGR